MNKIVSKYWGLAIIVLLSYFVVIPLFKNGFFPIHDDTQVARIFEMGKALRDGMFPVRWINDLGYGYGYPIYTFYAPLAYYFGGLLVVLGLDALLATKVTMGVGIILSAITMYFFARKYLGEPSACIAAIVYQFATYHAVDIYVRGDIAEFWAYAFLPLVFNGFTSILLPQTQIRSDHHTSSTKDFMQNFSAIVSGSIGYALVILSHNLTAFMATIVLLPYIVILVIFRKASVRVLLYVFICFFLGITLSAFYWLPVPFEMQYTNVLSQIGRSADFRQHFVCIAQFLYSPWGYGGSVPGCIDGLSFMLGKINIFLSVFGIGGTILLWRKKNRLTVLVGLASVGWLFTLFLTTNYSVIIWNILPAMSFLQYPWRFLLFAALFSAILAGSTMYVLQNTLQKKKTAYVFGVLVVCSVIFFQAKYFTPQKIVPVTVDNYISENVLHWKISKISDEYMPKNFPKPKNEQRVVSHTFLIQPSATKSMNSLEKTQIKTVRIVAKFESTSLLGLAYFPSWHYYIDNSPGSFRNLSGRILIRIPKGSHVLTMKYEQTVIEKLADILSLCGLFGIILAIIIVNRLKKHV